ncbi:MAG: hypothetical protein ACXWDF_09915 [Aeromicrobium sp.]
MKSAYRYLAYILAIEVVIQAAAIAFAIFGLGKWIDDGNTLDKAAIEDESTSFTGLAGFIVHGINGQMVIPLLVIILLIVSFFAKVPDGTKWAAVILVAVIAQVLLGIFGHELPALGILHGVNALFILAAASMAGQRVGSASSARVATEPV